jgi:hypothetical protein
MDAARQVPHEARNTTDETAALGERIAEHAAHLDAATHRLLADLRAFDAARGWYAQGARSCAEWLAWRVGWSSGTAREHVRVAQRLGGLPLIDEALRRGELSYCKARAITRVATPATEAPLLEDARFATGSQLERICRKYAAVLRVGRTTAHDDAIRRSFARHDLDDGMVKLDAILHPEEAAIVCEALTRIARERVGRGAGTRFCRVDALVELAEGVLRGDCPERSPVEIVVTVAAEALAGEAHGDGVAPLGTTADGSCLSIDATRRLACDAGIVEITEDASGVPLSVGRRTRAIPAAIKRALLRRDRHCRFPGCANHVFVDGHHVTHWVDGGETALDNLVTLCGHHHRFVHEYGYRVELDEAQQPRFLDAHGRPVLDAPARPWSAGMSELHRQNEPLAITAATNLPNCDGDPVDYERVIDGLLWVEEQAVN